MMCADFQSLPAQVLDYQPLVVLLGPTAVGKTQIALEIANRIPVEIVSADSRLLYIGMDIGTAKPSLADRARVPHHLIDVTTPDRMWSLAEYQAAATEAIHSIHERNHLPILVGGTGQYVHAVTQGWNIPPTAPNPSLRQALENWATQIGFQALHDRLARLDPQAAVAIDPPNSRRTVRALEVIFSTGRLFSEQKRRLAPPYAILQLGINRPRPELYQRIDERIDEMVQAGFMDEVQRLLDQGYSAELPTLSAIGYGEISAYLRGQCSLEEAIVLMKRRTRIFVRRQANWFKPEDPAIHWFLMNSDTPAQIEIAIHRWLNTLTSTTKLNPTAWR
jgi:tRNA dimethylallyltransferase